MTAAEEPGLGLADKVGRQARQSDDHQQEALLYA